MQSESQIWILTGCVFFAVSSIAALVGFYLARYQKIHRRLSESSLSPALPKHRLMGVRAITSGLGEGALGLGVEEKRSKLRIEMIKAGYFSADSIIFFGLAKITLAILFPLVAYVVLSFSWAASAGVLKVAIAAVAGYLGYLTPDIFIARRRQWVEADLRAAFPDFLDLLIVCVDAGLSMNAALDRVSVEFGNQSPALAKNLAITLSEIRSGRAFSEALEKFSDRMGIDEAKSFSALIKQSVELGTNVAEAMRVFADEMRQKRLLRAEERANTLSVRMLLPLGLFVFPVLFMVLMTPAIIRMISVFKQMQHS